MIIIRRRTAGASGDVPPWADPAAFEVWNRLPQVWREEDAAAADPSPNGRGDPGGYPLLRWLSGVASQLGAVKQLTDRIDFETVDAGGAPSDVSELVDPARADVNWLPWLGQLLGVRVNVTLSQQAQRDSVAGAVSGFRAGTRGAVADATRSILTGTRFVEVYPRSINNPGDGTMWDVLIVTRADETPASSADVVDAVTAKGAKPAGVVLHHRTYAATWQAIDAAFPAHTWAQRDAKPTWADQDQAGL